MTSVAFDVLRRSIALLCSHHISKALVMSGTLRNQEEVVWLKPS